MLLLFIHLSRVRFFAASMTAAPQASFLYYLPELLKFMSAEAVLPSNYLILYHPLLLLPSIFPSIRLFSNEPALHIRWSKYWSFSSSPSSDYSGLISCRIDSCNLLAIQGTLRSLLHHNVKAQTLGLSLIFGPALTSIHDYWEKFSFDYIDLCQQNDVSAF